LRGREPDVLDSAETQLQGVDQGDGPGVGVFLKRRPGGVQGGVIPVGLLLITAPGDIKLVIKQCHNPEIDPLHKLPPPNLTNILSQFLILLNDTSLLMPDQVTELIQQIMLKLSTTNNNRL
jgi:hypothetical protein